MTDFREQLGGDEGISATINEGAKLCNVLLDAYPGVINAICILAVARTLAEHALASSPRHAAEFLTNHDAFRALVAECEARTKALVEGCRDNAS